MISKFKKKKNDNHARKLKLKLRTKLIASFLFVSLIFGVASVVSYINMNQSNNSYSYIIDTVIEVRNISSEIEYNISRQSSNMRGYLLTEDEEQLERLEAANERIFLLIEEAKALSTIEETVQRLDVIEEMNEQYMEEVNLALNLGNTHIDRAIDRTVNYIIPRGRMMADEAEGFTEWLDGVVEEQYTQTTQETNQAMVFVVAMSVIAFILAIVSGIIVSNLISRPIIGLAKNAKQLASGDLSIEKLTVKSRDEVYDLNESFNEMTDSLRNMVSQISTNAEQVAASSEELTTSAEETSKATNQITESIQEVATGADNQVQSTNSANQTASEIKSGMQEIAKSVESVIYSSATADEKSANGTKVVENAVKQMGAIDTKTAEIANVVSQLGDKSKEIGSIISLITDVAEQTNLLALNAAIEAARAGEHGKGFAVVADEVRKLAEQSNHSANQIGNLVEDIQKGIDQSVSVMGEGRESVQKGINSVNEAGTEFGSISKSIVDISTQITEVSAAVQQISAGSESMAASVNEAANVAEQSSGYAQTVAASAEEQMASMEEITSAAETLASMAEELQVEVSKFKL
ncbi:methyl-accepting chemotaxis protein [Bacillus shivajii]|nr:methyl-accepting chemotaxis protein [Bacillus shivajii]UCZ53577.1 methyl-accepting chemotaxis protein [Bacillus shivajii]